MRAAVLLLACIAIASGCKKENNKTTTNPTPPEPVDTVTYTLTVKMSHSFGGTPFGFTGTYMNAAGNEVDFRTFKYILSNFSFADKNGKWHNVPESYVLIDHKDSASLTFTLKKVSRGEYVSMRFLIGVDSARTVSGPHTGVLNTGNGMFWDSTQQGYVFMVAEGTYSPPGKPYSYYIGGFSGAYTALRQATISFGSNELTLKDDNSQVNLNADVKQLFGGPRVIDCLTLYNISGPGKTASWMADNYATMFSFISVQ